MVGGDLRHGDGTSVKGSEFNLVAVAAPINVNDRSDIANRKPIVGEVGGQRHAVQFFDHVGRRYAVMKRGASLPVSRSQTVAPGPATKDEDGSRLKPTDKKSCGNRMDQKYLSWVDIGSEAKNL